METNKINYITIQQYLDGTLNKEAMHELEKQALDDPFLADAIDGYSAVNKPAAKQLSLLQSQLQDRIAHLQDDKNRFNFSWTRLSIAAAAALLFVTASMLFWIKTGSESEQLAQQPKQVEVNLMPQDSIAAVISSENAAQSATVVASAETAPEPKKVENEIASLSPSKQQAGARLNATTPLDKDLVNIPATETKQSFAMRAKASAVSTGSVPTVSGKVVSEAGVPIAGASVKLENSGTTGLTNLNGEFKLNDSVGGDLQVASLGFDSKKVKAESGTPVTIQLNENNAALNEVVVGYGSKAIKDSPEPAVGWVKYLEYLKENIALSGKMHSGEIIVTFNVGADNQLSNFKIEKGLDEASNQEAIRLIKNGPVWNLGKNSLARVVVLIN